MPQEPPPATTHAYPNGDDRSPGEVLRQYERLFTIRNRLISEGLLTGNANMHDVFSVLRQIVPPDIFSPV